ncbi:hypothetical protein AB0M57_01750 [Streptomyces sp. NPDC051597]|uniref:hypothetical protein n=1 Tax=Streptomyces sp. NPDC051597 TaxID=3155049 RepID=UPI003418B213
MRRHVRDGAGAVALAACLALAGCSGSDGGDKAGKSPDGGGKSASPTATGGAGNGSNGGGTVAAKDIAGAWAAVLQGKPTALVISGTNVALGGEHTCSGTVSDNGMAMIELKCADGNTDRAAGMPSLSKDGKTLTVKWEGGATDTFTKSELDGKLPTGIPTAGLPTP